MSTATQPPGMPITKAPIRLAPPPDENDLVWYMGVDPGQNGAMAFYHPGSKDQDGKLKSRPALHIVDFKQSFNGGSRYKELDVRAIAGAVQLFVDLNGRPKLSVIETPHSLPNDGHVGAFRFGKACGHIEGIVAAFGIPIIATLPAVWKPQMGLTSIKQASIDKAISLFYGKAEMPEPYFEKKKHDGRAEAALLAWMGSEKFK